MGALLHDFQNAWRSVCRTRSTAILAIALIAAGIGVNTAVFTLLDRMVLRKIALPEPDRLIHFNGFAQDREPVPLSILERLRERHDLFAGVSGWLDQFLPVEVGNETVPAVMVRVEGDFYRVTGARAQIGRLLGPEDRGPVAVISDQFWRTRFGHDAGVLGRAARVGGTVLTVVGVMPPQFSGMIANVSADIAVPLAAMRPSRLEPVARLQAGVTFELARAQIRAMWPGLLARTVPSGTSLTEWTAKVGSSVKVEPASHGQFLWREEYERPLFILLGMATLLLLIVCANLAGVLLARGVSRRREIAIRFAMGAGRGRIISQLVMESLLLAAAGAIASVFVARWASALGASFLPMGNVPFDRGMNLRSLGFAAGLAFCTAIIFGIVPALVGSRINGARGSGRTREALLALQVAASTVLVTGSLLFAITLLELSAERLGFRPDGVLALVVQGKSDKTVDSDYFDELLGRLRDLPEVESASIANALPMEYAQYGETGEVSRPGAAWVTAEAHCAFPGYSSVLGTPVLQGRAFERPDRSAIVISQALSRRLFGEGESVGQTLRQKRDGKTEDRTVIGVISDVKYGSPRDPAAAAFYVPCLDEWTPDEAARNAMTIAIRGRGTELERAARRQVDALGRQYVLKAATLSSLVGVRTLRERMFAVVTSAFGALTLALVGVGLYGLVGFFVASRTREIGIRVAIGAQRRDIFALLTRQVVGVLAGGLGIGLICAATAAKLVSSYLFGVRALEPGILALTAAILTLGGALAILQPLRHALGIQPAAALRHE
jgi:predicted permease